MIDCGRSGKRIVFKYIFYKVINQIILRDGMHKADCIGQKAEGGRGKCGSEAEAGRLKLLLLFILR